MSERPHVTPFGQCVPPPSQGASEHDGKPSAPPSNTTRIVVVSVDRTRRTRPYVWQFRYRSRRAKPVSCSSAARMPVTVGFKEACAWSSGFLACVNGNLDRPSSTCGITMTAKAKAAGDTTVGCAGDGRLQKRASSSNARKHVRAAFVERRTLRKKHSSMEDSSGQENGVLHGATRNRSRPETKVAGDEESRASPAGTLRKTTFATCRRKKRRGPVGDAAWNRATLRRVLGQPGAPSQARTHCGDIVLETFWIESRGENGQVGLHGMIGSMAETGSIASRPRNMDEPQGSFDGSRASWRPPRTPSDGDRGRSPKRNGMWGAPRF